MAVIKPLAYDSDFILFIVGRDVTLACKGKTHTVTVPPGQSIGLKDSKELVDSVWPNEPVAPILGSDPWVSGTTAKTRSKIQIIRELRELCTGYIDSRVYTLAELNVAYNGYGSAYNQAEPRFVRWN